MSVAASLAVGVALLAQHASLLAQTGDAERGKALYESRCSACHSVDANRTGPLHAGVFGRGAGGVRGYDYSPALKAARFKWDARTLDAWLADPESLVPGQRMGYAVSSAQDRADLIAYLATLEALR